MGLQRAKDLNFIPQNNCFSCLLCVICLLYLNKEKIERGIMFWNYSFYHPLDLGWIPGLGTSPGEGTGYPLQYSGLENSMYYTVANSWTRLSDFHFTSFFRQYPFMCVCVCGYIHFQILKIYIFQVLNAIMVAFCINIARFYCYVNKT